MPLVIVDRIMYPTRNHLGKLLNVRIGQDIVVVTAAVIIVAAAIILNNLHRIINTCIAAA